jgi:hypothetical protein
MSVGFDMEKFGGGIFCGQQFSISSKHCRYLIVLKISRVKIQDTTSFFISWNFTEIWDRSWTAKKSQYIPRRPISAACETSFLDRSQRHLLINFCTITAFPGARLLLVLNACGFYISLCTKFGQIFHLNLGARLAIHGSMDNYCAYMMYSQHSSLAQLFGDDSDGFRSGLDDDVRTWKFVVE